MRPMHFMYNVDALNAWIKGVGFTDFQRLSHPYDREVGFRLVRSNERRKWN
jgi:hypothetical protein